VWLKGTGIDISEEDREALVFIGQYPALTKRVLATVDSRRSYPAIADEVSTLIEAAEADIAAHEVIVERDDLKALLSSIDVLSRWTEHITSNQSWPDPDMPGERVNGRDLGAKLRGMRDHVTRMLRDHAISDGGA
jgi:hypothetical protein